VYCECVGLLLLVTLTTLSHSLTRHCGSLSVTVRLSHSVTLTRTVRVRLKVT